MLHYFEHVLIIIHRVADGESSELCGERICSGTKNPLLDGLSRNLEAVGQCLEVRPFFFCDQGMVAKGCHVMGGQSPIMRAFSLGIVACHRKL